MEIPEATIEQMMEADRISIEEFKISFDDLMENAGKITAEIIEELYPKEKDVLVLVGKGNNGGDGLVVAKFLHKKGYRVSVVIADDVKESLKHRLLEVKEAGIPVYKDIVTRADIIVDALLGYNSKGAPTGNFASIIEDALKIDVPVISIDIPSGFDVSNNMWHDISFENAVVVTLGLPKINMINNLLIKKLFVADIGIPSEAFAKLGINSENVFMGKEYIEIIKTKKEERSE